MLRYTLMFMLDAQPTLPSMLFLLVLCRRSVTPDRLSVTNVPFIEENPDQKGFGSHIETLQLWKL